MKRAIVFLAITFILFSNPSYAIEQESNNYIVEENAGDKSPEGNNFESNSRNEPSIISTQKEDTTKKDTNKNDYAKVLTRLGYYKKDGSEDLNLRNAIIRFQSDYNLKVDGVWGEASQSNLDKRMETGEFYYRDTILNAPTEGKWVVINKTKRILTLYQGDKVLKKYPIAVGNPVSLTPDGKFQIANRVINPAWGGGGYAKPIKGGAKNNPLGLRWIGISYKGGGRVGMHGNASPYSIGLSVSHGCIRMINSDVKEFFDMVGVNEAVWIGTVEVLKEWGVTQEEYYKK